MILYDPLTAGVTAAKSAIGLAGYIEVVGCPKWRLTPDMGAWASAGFQSCMELARAALSRLYPDSELRRAVVQHAGLPVLWAIWQELEPGGQPDQLITANMLWWAAQQVRHPERHYTLVF